MNVPNIALYFAIAFAWIGIVSLAAKISDLEDKLDSLRHDLHRDDTQWVKTVKAYVDVVYDTLNAKLNNKQDKKERRKNPS